jgi:hypothetical protein
MWSSLFWDVESRWLVVTDVSGQCIGPIFKPMNNFLLDFLTIEDGTGGVPKRRYQTTNQDCATSQKSEDLNYTAEETLNLA